jgi:hypothetical protein
VASEETACIPPASRQAGPVAEVFSATVQTEVVIWLAGMAKITGEIAGPIGGFENSKGCRLY